MGAGHFYDVINADAVQGVANSMGLENIIPVSIVEHDRESGHTIAQIQGNKLLLPYTEKFSIGERCYISVRSSEIAIAKQHIAHISIQNQLKGNIVNCLKSTACVAVHVDIGIGANIVADISPKAFTELNFQQGDDIYCLIKVHSFAFLGSVGS